jgi:hypothetical protein
MTWARHDAVLGGRLQHVVNAIQRLPGIVERNERRLQQLAERQRAVMDALAAPQPAQDQPKDEDQLSTLVGNP